MAKGTSIAVFGAKGGTGKTIFTLNLAGAIAKLGKTCLIVDADLYSGQIDCALNKKTKKDIYNFADDYSNNRYKDFEDYVTVYNKNISFIGAPTDPRRANKIEPKYLSIILDKAIFKYDFVIFDMSHILNEVNVNILDMVDKILLMTTNDPLDLKNLKTVLSLFKDSNINKYKVIEPPFETYLREKNNSSENKILKTNDIKNPTYSKEEEITENRTEITDDKNLRNISLSLMENISYFLFQSEEELEFFNKNKSSSSGSSGLCGYGLDLI